MTPAKRAILFRNRPSLLTSLVAYYSFESLLTDFSGNGNTLTNTNTVTTGVGKVGSNSASFVRTSSQYLSVANTQFQTTGSVSMAAWFQLASIVATYKVLFGIHGDTFKQWSLQIDSSHRLRSVISSNGTNETEALVTTVLTASVWHFGVLWYDSVAQTINCQMDNGTPISTSFTSAVFQGSGAMRFGASNTPGDFHDGLVDEAGFWKRVLTSDERTALYNGGSGRTYPFVGT